jgi:2-phosphosulfolactate phosphatase
VADAVLRLGLGVTLLCAGTDGEVAMEDLLGAGAVIRAMLAAAPARAQPVGDTAHIALRLFDSCQGDLRAALSESQGGRNVIRAGLAEDVEFASRLDAVPVVGVADKDAPVIRAFQIP